MIAARISPYLFISAAGMLLAVFHAVTAFLMALLDRPAIPTTAAGILLLAAMATTCIHRQRGWRPAALLGLHLPLFLLAVHWFCHTYPALHLPLFGPARMWAFWCMDRSPGEWLPLIFLVSCGAVLWFGGIRLCTRETDITTINHRFDLGLAVFLVVLMIRLLIAVKGGETVPWQHFFLPFIAYLIMGLHAMGHSRTRPSPGSLHLGGEAVIAGVIVSALILGSGLFILFLPELQGIAGKGSGLVAAAGHSLGQRLASLFHFLSEIFQSREVRLVADISATAPGIPATGSGTGWMAPALLLLIPLFFLLLLLHRLLVWLFTATGAAGNDHQIGFYRWILLRLLAFFCGLFRGGAARPCRARRYYHHLRRWGGLSGLPPECSETPGEYGLRLAARFPAVGSEIETIIGFHEAAIYAGAEPQAAGITHARKALRTLHSPLLWPERLKALVLRSAPGPEGHRI